MESLKLWVVWIEDVLVNVTRLVQLLLAHIGDVVSRLRQTATHGFLQDLGFFDNCHSVVVVAAPLILFVVLNVGVIMTAFGSSVVNYDSVQVILHLLQANILAGKLLLLVCDLVL